MNPRSDCPLHAKPRASRLVDAFSRISTFQSRSRTVSACVRLSRCGRVAQLVEQRPFKAWVAGSNPAALTTFAQEFSRERSFALSAQDFACGLKRPQNGSSSSRAHHPPNFSHFQNIGTGTTNSA